MTAPRNSFASTQIPAAKTDIPYPDYVKMVQGLFPLMTECRAGTIADATGAAMDVALTFDPGVVLIFNETDLSVHLKTPTMATGKSAEWKADVAYNAANGIDLGTLKFTIGTAANLNALHDVLHWVALGFKGTVGTD